MESTQRQLEGKVALITGGSAGIGRATALAFAAAGAKVAVASRGAKGNAETVELIRKSGGEAVAFEVDVSKEADVVAAVTRTVERYGRLDCAVNNAGVAPRFRSVFEFSEAEWDEIMDINLKGVWLCMKHEIGQMLKQGGGSIINMSSTAGLCGARWQALYSASKHGVLGLTRTAALELATSRIRVNAVCPGVVQRTTLVERVKAEQPEMAQMIAATHPMNRVADPEEVAAAVLWLASDAASFVTGSALSVDGGFMAGR